jgi:hypothetical protein
MGYNESKQEFFLRIPVLRRAPRAGGCDPASEKRMARNSDSRKLLHGWKRMGFPSPPVSEESIRLGVELNKIQGPLQPVVDGSES